MKHPIDIRLIDCFHHTATEIAENAGFWCYQAEPPVMGEEQMNVEKSVFNTSHHTTIGHKHYMFRINGASIGAYTFGLHLGAPFYDSDQRSGRFCLKMFETDDTTPIEHFVRQFWPELTEHQYAVACRFAAHGLRLFREATPRGEVLMAEQIRRERPKASEKYIASNARKFAQEQLRMVVPIAFPTGGVYTLSLIGIVQLWQTAWTRELRFITDRMRDLVLKRDPEVSYMFNEARRGRMWTPAYREGAFECYQPELDLLPPVGDWNNIVLPQPEDMHPVDTLQYHPGYMRNQTIAVHTRVRISLATMGQDQRHRTIHRSNPILTGGFYSPFMITKCIETAEIEALMREYTDLRGSLPEDLVFALAPYGAMVEYEKLAPINAFTHEHSKRECWCAQEEISNLSLILRKQIEERYGKDCKVLKLLAPPCYSNGGKCVEGDRFCGRNIITKDAPNADRCFDLRTI